MRFTVTIATFCVFALAADAQDFEPFPEFPAPAAGAFTAVGTALPDGRLLVWNGDEVFLQRKPDANRFTPIASGYAGDPAFLLYEPSRNAVLLGAGTSGDIYRLDLDAPADYTAEALVLNTPHYSAVLLTDTLLLIDVGKPGFTGSELQVVDISGAKSAPLTVVSAAAGPKELVVDKPPFTYSASLALDQANDIVYSVSAFGAPQELRYFQVADLLNAYTTATPLDWAADSVLIGSPNQFNSGGVAGILANGLLVVPGVGSIQLVDPSLSDPLLAAVVDIYNPDGLGGFYSVIFNSVTDVILAVDGSGNVFAPMGAVVPLPAAGLAGLLLLAGALGILGRKFTR